MSQGPGCVERGCGKSTREEMQGEQGWVKVQAEGEQGGKQEVVSKEISIRIIVTCGHDSGRYWLVHVGEVCNAWTFF